MPKRTRYNDEDPFPVLHTTDDLGMPDCDTTWVFDADADPMHMHFPDFASTEVDMPALQPAGDSHIHPDIVAGHDFSSGYQTSNGSSFSVPLSRLTSISSSTSSSSSAPSPHFPAAAAVESQRTQPGQISSMWRSQRCGPETCLAAALRTLTTLHIAHSACLSAHRETAAAQQVRKMGTVLSTNKDVVASMGPILACSCSAKLLVQQLLLSICGNLITWTSAMIGGDLELGDDPFSPARALSVSPTPTPSARVLPQPITIGQHQINGKLGRALHAQVMAGELRILEGLVDALSRRFCEVSRSESASPAVHGGNVNGRTIASRETPSMQSRGLSDNVHRQVISTLRTRLEHTRARIFHLN